MGVGSGGRLRAKRVQEQRKNDLNLARRPSFQDGSHFMLRIQMQCIGELLCKEIILSGKQFVD